MACEQIPSNILFFSIQGLTIEPGPTKLVTLEYNLSGPCDDISFVGGFVVDDTGADIPTCGINGIFCLPFILGDTNG